MIYFGNPTANPEIHRAMRDGELGFIDTPSQSQRPFAGTTWCADNGCFNDAKFDAGRWWAWLKRRAVDAESCAFATAPDVVGNHIATLLRSEPWLPRIRKLGFPAAFVAQDGATIETVPWDSFDALFIGGTTEFKLGPEARKLALHAKSLGKWVHMGRVNSGKRFRYAESIGCDSADGTFLRFAPTENLGRLMRWVDDLKDNPALFGAEAVS
jgi:hypothetical protein